MADRALLNSPLINYFRYLAGEDAGKPLDSGTIEFFQAENHAINVNVFRDSSFSTPFTNPIILDSIGSVPPIYMSDRLYYIVIKDKFNNIIETIDDYVPNNGGGSVITSSKSDFNVFSNSQFSYPVSFSDDDTIDASDTEVSLGWEFVQDVKSTTKNKVYSTTIATEALEGNPIYSLNIDSSSIDSSESRKDLIQQISDNANQWQGETFNISFQAKTLISGTTTVGLYLQKNYGAGGSPTEEVSLSQFSVTDSWGKYSTSVLFPSGAGKVIGTNSSLYILLRFNVGTTCKVAITNMYGIFGENIDVSTKGYPELKRAEEMPEGLFNGLHTAHSDDKYMFSREVNLDILKYYQGKVHISDTESGKPETFLTGKNPLGYVLAGSALDSKGYTNNIPNIRLYKYFGNTFGESGDLSVQHKETSITFTNIGDGKLPLSPFSIGNQGAKVTLTENNKGQKFEVKASKVSDNTILIEYLNNFAPTQTPYGASPPNPTGLPSRVIGCSPYWLDTSVSSPGAYTPYFICTNISAGSPTTKASGHIIFESSDVSKYKTSLIRGTNDNYKNVSQSFLYFPSLAANNVGGYYWQGRPGLSSMGISFTVDKKGDMPVLGAVAHGNFDFKTMHTLSKNLDNLVQEINDPYGYTFTINARPDASSYIEYSSGDVSYYIWFTVDSVGVDPALPSKTGIQVDLLSADTPTTSSSKIFAELQTHTFNLPTSAQLGLTPGAGFSSYIHL